MKRQHGSHRTDGPERVHLNIKTPSKPADEFFASEESSRYEQGR
jgi:hypothetical protein